MLTARFYYEEFDMSVKTFLQSEPSGSLMAEEFMIVLILKLALFLRVAETINYIKFKSKLIVVYCTSLCTVAYNIDIGFCLFWYYQEFQLPVLVKILNYI